MRLPEFERRYVAAEKVTQYLLNVDHPDGGPKARFFLRFGFDPNAPEILKAALLAHPDRHDAKEAELTVTGMKFLVDGPLSSPDGRDPWVRTVWLAPPHGAPSFVTAYPLRRRS